MITTTIANPIHIFLIRINEQIPSWTGKIPFWNSKTPSWNSKFLLGFGKFPFGIGKPAFFCSESPAIATKILGFRNSPVVIGQKEMSSN